MCSNHKTNIIYYHNKEIKKYFIINRNEEPINIILNI